MKQLEHPTAFFVSSIMPLSDQKLHLNKIKVLIQALFNI